MNSKQPNHTPQLRHYRKRAGMTQAQFAKQLSIHPKTLSKIENGRIYFSEGLQYEIASRLGLSGDEVPLAFGLPVGRFDDNRKERSGESSRVPRLTVLRPGTN